MSQLLKMAPGGPFSSTSTLLLDRYHSYSRRYRCPKAARLARRAWRRALAGWFPKDLTTPILDIGCGEGEFLSFLQDSGYTALEGFDLSAENVELCRQRGLAFVRQFDALKLKEWNGAPGYGAIYALDLIEHLPKQDAAGFLQAARELLLPGGFLVLQTPNMGNLWGCWHRNYCLSHEWGLTEKSAVTLLMVAGFREQEIELRPCRSAVTLVGRAREAYSLVLHRLLWMTEHRGRPTISTQNLLIRGVRS